MALKFALLCRLGASGFESNRLFQAGRWSDIRTWRYRRRNSASVSMAGRRLAPQGRDYRDAQKFKLKQNNSSLSSRHDVTARQWWFRATSQSDRYIETGEILKSPMSGAMQMRATHASLSFSILLHLFFFLFLSLVRRMPREWKTWLYKKQKLSLFWSIEPIIEKSQDTQCSIRCLHFWASNWSVSLFPLPHDSQKIRIEKQSRQKPIQEREKRSKVGECNERWIRKRCVSYLNVVERPTDAEDPTLSEEPWRPCPPIFISI